MQSTIGPEVARSAVALRQSHPAAPVLDVLDLCLRRRAGSLKDFGPEIEPATPFGFILAEAFDKGMAPEDWLLYSHPNTPPAVVQVLRGIWDGEVLDKFASRYGLAR